MFNSFIQNSYLLSEYSISKKCPSVNKNVLTKCF
nr:MAG TPA: hypothetical protein [Caudoviricetes sp.]DAY97002.1 MAG TPA: hypothetical protein [Caudoviricetes sp.]